MKISFNPSNSNKNILDLIKNNKDIIFDLKGHSIFARGVEFKGTDTNTWRDIKINNVSIGSHTLDLRNGSNTTLTNTNGVVTINSTWRPVVDNLTSDSTTSSLSAKQGKVLKALIDGKSNSDHNHDGRYVRYYAVTTLDCNNLAAGLTAARISATNAAHTNHSAYLYISDVGTPFQIQIPDSSIPYIYKRYYGSGKWSGWFKLSAGYADSAGSVAWNNVTGKPSSYTPSAHTHAWNSLTHSSTTENQAILTNGKANGWKLQTLNIARWDNAANNAHSHANKSVLDGITSALVNSWNTAYNFVSNITGTDTDKVINKWEEIVNFLAGITEDNKLNTLLNSKLSIQQISAKDILTTKTNNALFWVDTKGNASTITTGPFTDHPYALLSVTNYNQNAENHKFFYRSRLAFSSAGDIKVASCHHEYEYQQDETWYNVLTSKNSGINGSTIKLNGTSITVYSSGTADGRYLKLTGGWMSGDINFGGDNKIHWERNTDSASISFKNDGDGDANSYMSFNTSDNGNEYFRWSHSSGSTNTEWMALRSDGLRVRGTKVSLEGHSHNDLYYTKAESDGRYLKLTGGWMSGDINFGGDNKIHWERNTDSASISFKNDGDGDANSYMSFNTSDNGNEYFRWSHSSGSTNTEWMALRSDGLRVRGTKVSLEGHSHNDLYYTKAESDGRYVKKSGDTMSGVLTIDTTNFGALTIKRNDDANGASIQFRGKSSVYGYIGLNNSTKDKQFLRWSSDTSRIYTILDTSSTYISNGKGVINGTEITQVNNSDTVDGYHAASFVKMKQFRFHQYKEGFWTKILTITINSTSDLQPVIAFNWIPSECAREVWAEFTINWRSNSPIFYAIWKGTAVRTLTCVNSSGNIWNVWVQGDKNSYDPFGEVQVTYAHNISSYNGGSLGYSDSDPGGTRCTLGGYVNYARSTGNADTLDGYHASAFSYKSWWHWYGKDGQPNWLWGGNNENDYYVYNPSNFRVAYAASAGNADTLDGYPANGSNDRPYGHIPTIESDGVMEVGRYIDFHNDNNGKHDFSTRLQSTGNYGNEVNLPSASGTLALINDVNNYYWANVKISASSSTTTSPTVHTLTATRVCAGHNPGIDNSISCSNWFRSSGNTGWYNTTYQGGWYMSDTSWIRAHNGVGIYTSGQIYSSSSIRMGNILLEHTDEINNSANGGIHLNYRNSGNVSLCYGGGNVGIGTTTPSYKLDVNGQMRASGFHHSSVNSDNYILLAGGGYKSFGGDDSTPIFLGYLNLFNGNDGTISSSFPCLGYSVPFTYTRGGAYCLINIPNTSFQTFYIKAAIASVHYSGAGMGDWVGNHRGEGAWWLHCDAVGSNAVQVKGFHLANEHNNSWWGGNPLYSGNGAAKIITVCLFGYVKFR